MSAIAKEGICRSGLVWWTLNIGSDLKYIGSVLCRGHILDKFWGRQNGSDMLLEWFSVIDVGPVRNLISRGYLGS